MIDYNHDGKIDKNDFVIEEMMNEEHEESGYCRKDIMQSFTGLESLKRSHTVRYGSIRMIYSLDEITEIFCKLGLRICNSFVDFSGKPSSDNDIQLMVYSIRE